MAAKDTTSTLGFVPLHPYVQDITGKQFSRLKVLGYAGKKQWFCECVCGNINKVYGYALKSGNTQSCGCLQKEKTIEASVKHNKTRTAEYSVWSDMKTRCLNPNSKFYKNYGGRGKKICERWLHSFENFLADIGKRPTANHSIDRIDNDGDYKPENCRWKTKREQNNNRRSNVSYTYNGKTQRIAEWCKHAGINYQTFATRITVELTGRGSRERHKKERYRAPVQ